LSPPFSPGYGTEVKRTPPREEDLHEEFDVWENVTDDQGQALEDVTKLLIEERSTSDMVKAQLSDRLCAAVRENKRMEEALKEESQRAEEQRQKAALAMNRAMEAERLAAEYAIELEESRLQQQTAAAEDAAERAEFLERIGIENRRPTAPSAAEVFERMGMENLGSGSKLSQKQWAMRQEAEIDRKLHSRGFFDPWESPRHHVSSSHAVPRMDDHRGILRGRPIRHHVPMPTSGMMKGMKSEDPAQYVLRPSVRLPHNMRNMGDQYWQ